LALGDRHSQYDLWHPNPIDDDAHFHGRTFIVVGDVHPLLRGAFDEIETPRTVTHYEHGLAVAQWTVSVCRGFHGFHNQPDWVNNAHF
jgi:hypothetical protein